MVQYLLFILLFFFLGGCKGKMLLVYDFPFHSLHGALLDILKVSKKALTNRHATSTKES